MNRNAGSVCLLVLALAGWGGCSSRPPAAESKKAGTPLDKIQGKALITAESTATDSALNAGGPSVYLTEGLHRYRLFFKTAVPVVQGKEYVAEGVNAQKVIDDIGDPDQGKNGYPLESSCERAVKMAWSNLPFDVLDGQTSVLRARVKRYPARPVFLVTSLQPVTADGAGSPQPNKDADDQDLPEVSVPAEKQRALLIEGPAVQPAPLWEPTGGTVLCKVVVNSQGKISELGTGMQLCESVPWSQFRYQPPVDHGHPVKVKTEVEVRFEPRK
ncbi:MAG: energy transducer TonB [Acidobacteriia bacterium]|nr:energy transducer TonB [Terriglobia bacterium]